MLNFLLKNHVSHFEINHMYFIRMIQFFYGLLSLYYYNIFLSHPVHHYAKLSETISYLWPVQWLNFFSERSAIISIFIILGFLSSGACVFLPRLRLFRFLSFLFLFQTLPIYLHSSHYASVGHNFYSSLFISFFLIFIDLNKNRGYHHYSEKNNLYLWAIQVSFLGTYFLPGLWKLRKFIAYLMEQGLEGTQCLESNLAWGYLYNNINTPFHMQILEFVGKFDSFLWISLILFQLSTLLAAWFPPVQRFYGLMIILFHILTGATMNIHWHFTQFVAFIILICHPWQRKK